MDLALAIVTLAVIALAVWVRALASWAAARTRYRSLANQAMYLNRVTPLAVVVEAEGRLRPRYVVTVDYPATHQRRTTPALDHHAAAAYLSGVDAGAASARFHRGSHAATEADPISPETEPVQPLARPGRQAR